MAHHVSTIRTHLQPGTGRITLHLGSALLVGTCAASTTAVSLARRAFSRTRHPHTRRATERSGLVVVVTHRPPPENAAERFPRTTFTGSVEEGIATAKEIAGDKFVTIASADIIQQALNLGLVDELCISQVPVLFGTGIRYFGELVG